MYRECGNAFDRAYAGNFASRKNLSVDLGSYRGIAGGTKYVLDLIYAFD